MTYLLWVWVVLLSIASLANYAAANYVMAGADIIAAAVATVAARVRS